MAGAIVYAAAYRDDVKARARAYMPMARTRFDATRVADDLEVLFRRITGPRSANP